MGERDAYDLVYLWSRSDHRMTWGPAILGGSGGWGIVGFGCRAGSDGGQRSSSSSNSSSFSRNGIRVVIRLKDVPEAEEQGWDTGAGRSWGWWELSCGCAKRPQYVQAAS